MPPLRPTSPHPAPLLAAALLCLGVALYPPINLDVCWYLVGARSWATGGELYVTLRDPNTPAVWYLFLGIERLAVWLGLPPHRLFYLLVALATLLLLAFAARLLPGEDRAARRQRLGLFLGGAFLCGYSALTVAGQRDPLVVLLLLPYLAWTQRLASGVTGDGRGRGTLATLLAGLGLLIKPHFLILMLLAEALLARRRRHFFAWYRADLLGPALATLLLGALLLTLHPAYLDYLARYAGYYAAFPAAPLSSRALFGLLLLGLLLACRLLLGWGDRGWGDRGWGDTLLLAALGALLTALLQDKWWDYQAVPLETLAGLAWLALLLGRSPSELWGLRWRRLGIQGLALLALAWFAGAAVSASKQQARFVLAEVHQPAPEALAAALDRLAPGEAVAILGGPQGPIAAYLSSTRLALPDPSYWVVDLLGQVRAAGRLPAPVFLEAERRHLADVAAALADRPPRMLAFYQGDDEGRPDALAYYGAQPAIAAILDRYRPAGEAGGYRLMLRPAP